MLIESKRFGLSIYTDRASSKSSFATACSTRRQRRGRGTCNARRGAAGDMPAKRAARSFQSVTAPSDADDTWAAYFASTPRV